MARDVSNNEIISDINDLIAYFEDGCKKDKAGCVGTEHEKFLFYLDSNDPVPYHGENGINNILQRLSKCLKWQEIIDNGNIIGLIDTNSGAAISLEPGGQFELSGAAVKNIHATEEELQEHFRNLRAVVSDMNIGFLGIGASPKSCLGQTPRTPKSRYAIMRHYMPEVGSLGLGMMHQTCTIQSNLDYFSEEDMRNKMQIGLKLQPFVTALFAASPFNCGTPCGLLSWRAAIWQDTDNARTGLLPFAFCNDFGFEDYTNWALDIPMYFILRDGKYHDATHVTFRQFMNGALKGEVDDYQANMGDWINHLGTLFPDVRLKQYLEMRGADFGAYSHISALSAFWVGLLYDKSSLEKITYFTKDWSVEQIAKLRGEVPSFALNSSFGNHKLKDIVKEVVDIANEGLKRRHELNANGQDETIYLEPLYEIIKSGKTLAEIWKDKYYADWKLSIDPLFKQARL